MIIAGARADRAATDIPGGAWQHPFLFAIQHVLSGVCFFWAVHPIHGEWTPLMGITYCSDGTTENGEPALVAGTRAFLPRWALALTEQRPPGGAIRLRGGRTAVSARAVCPFIR